MPDKFPEPEHTYQFRLRSNPKAKRKLFKSRRDWESWVSWYGVGKTWFSLDQRRELKELNPDYFPTHEPRQALERFSATSMDCS